MSLRRRTIGTTTALLLAVAGVTACEPAPPPVIPPIPGLTTTYVPPSFGSDGRSNGSLTTVTLTTAHTLTVRNMANHVVINGVTTGVGCNDMDALNVTGTNAADDVTIDLACGGPAITVNLLAGNDRAVVSGPGVSDLTGGDGNDTLSALTRYPFRTAGHGPATEVSRLNGGAGNDTLTNLGWDDGEPLMEIHFVPCSGGGACIDEYGMQLNGGLGADVLHGSTNRPDLVVMDPFDTLDLQGGPGDVLLQGTDLRDNIDVELNGNYGPKGVVTTTDGVAHPFALPTQTRTLTIDAGAGPDVIAIHHRSSHTDVEAYGGPGGYQLVLYPSVATYTVDHSTRTMSQGAPWHDVRWGSDITSVSVVPQIRP